MTEPSGWKTTTLFSGIGWDVYFTGEESGLLWEDPLFALQNAVEWRAVTARSPEERAQVHSMSYLLNTCKGVSNLELIEEGARWIQQGSEQEERRGEELLV